MLTKAEREKVYYTRGFRNFCFRASLVKRDATPLTLT